MTPWRLRILGTVSREEEVAVGSVFPDIRRSEKMAQSRSHGTATVTDAADTSTPTSKIYMKTYFLHSNAQHAKTTT